MDKYYIEPGCLLWYCNRDTGEVGSARVLTTFADGFTFRFNGRIRKLPNSALGTRLFLTREGALRPGKILEPKRQSRTGFWDREIEALANYDIDADEALTGIYGPDVDH